MNIRWLALGLLAVALGGCGTTAVLGEGSKRTIDSDESLIVLGVNPGYRVTLYLGEIIEGKFKQTPFLGPVINGASTDGYIVAKATAGQVLGLTSVNQQGLMTGTDFTACGDARVPVFHVPKGQLLYLADIRYQPNGGKLSIRYEDRMDAATAFVRSKYPQFQGDLQRVQVEALPTMRTCGGGTMYVPIYLGR